MAEKIRLREKSHPLQLASVGELRIPSGERKIKADKSLTARNTRGIDEAYYNGEPRDHGGSPVND